MSLPPTLTDSELDALVVLLEAERAAGYDPEGTSPPVKVYSGFRTKHGVYPTVCGHVGSRLARKGLVHVVGGPDRSRHFALTSLGRQIAEYHT